MLKLLNIVRFYFLFFSESLIFQWFRIEIISFFLVIHIILNKNNINKWKNYFILKYFLIQTFFAAVIIFTLYMFYLNFIVCFFFFLLFFFIKLRSFPRHLWVSEIFLNLNFLELFLLGTIPKIPGIIIFYNLRFFNFFFFFWFSITTVIVSVLSALNKTSIRSLLAFSSILNIRWVLLSLGIDINLFLMCFSLYSLRLCVLIIFFNKSNIINIVETNDLYINNNINMLIRFLIFSIIRLPRRFVFFFKFFIIMNSRIFFLFILLLFFTSFSFFFYIYIIWIFIKKKNTKIFFFLINYKFYCVLLILFIPFFILYFYFKKLWLKHYSFKVKKL